jgi:hypothetical protein
MSSVWQDLRFGARFLLRDPSVTTLALLTLSLCIGANTAIFSVINGVLLEPLPFPRPEQLTVVIESAPKLGFSEMGGSPPNFNDWRSRNQVFSSLTAFRRRRLTLTGSGGEPQALAVAAVTGDFFRTLGVPALAGRLLGPEDDRPGAEKVAVMGAGLWHQRFGGDPGIVQRRDHRRRQLLYGGRRRPGCRYFPRTRFAASRVKRCGTRTEERASSIRPHSAVFTASSLGNALAT